MLQGTTGLFESSIEREKKPFAKKSSIDLGVNQHVANEIQQTKQSMESSCTCDRFYTSFSSVITKIMKMYLKNSPDVNWKHSFL